MKEINFADDPHKQKHFDFFNGMDQPHFGITAEVDITDFLRIVRASPSLRFTPAMVYLVTKAALEVAPFRWRIRGGRIVEHENLRPSFAVPTATSAAFSFCTVTYTEDVVDFHREAEAKMESMRRSPSLEDEPGADDYLFLSTFPWVSFTSVTHAMRSTPGDSVPRIVWGKYKKIGDKMMMPLAVQAHHAVVDGSDIGAFYQKIENFFQKSETIFHSFNSLRNLEKRSNIRPR